MTTSPTVADITARLQAQFAEGVTYREDTLLVSPALLLQVSSFLKSAPGMEFDFLEMLAAVDNKDHFEIAYRLLSIKNNLQLSFKVTCSHDNPVVPSVTNLWQGASFQEREIFDLFGIVFSGHPDLKRIVLWEGYQGYPLRKDFKDRVYGSGN
jgi:NADH-quinone oxidoreductase subunit C